MNNTTLVSLAMLKVKIDSGNDYLDYFTPFIIDVLSKKKPEKVDEKITKNLIEEEFGLTIPERTIQILLKRLKKKSYLKKESGLYFLTKKFPDSQLNYERVAAQRCINTVIKDIKLYWENYGKILTEQEIEIALLSVLSDFTAPALSAYLNATAIPDEIVYSSDSHVLIGKYILDIYDSEPEKLEDFILVLKGHMIANAILCPDLQSVKNSYKDLTIYLDTPLIIQLLGFDGILKEDAIKELLKTIKDLKGSLAIFDHTYGEVVNVLNNAANLIDNLSCSTPIVNKVRKNKISKSDIMFSITEIKSKLHQESINIEKTPKHSKDFQIDEKLFEDTLDKNISYNYHNSKLKDIDSVRSIYELRKGSRPQSLEDSLAVLVTSNEKLSKAAFEFGKKYREAEKVSSVVTDFSLINMAWLKAPFGSLPKKEILAFSYASMCLDKSMLKKFFLEIEKLRKDGNISERQHQMLITNSIVDQELMSMTMGCEDALTQETVIELAVRIEDEIKKEEREKLNQEKEEHKFTRKALDLLKNNRDDLSKKAYLKCKKKAERLEKIINTLLVFVFIVGGIVSLISFKSLIMRVILIISFLISMLNVWNGLSIKSISKNISNKYFKYLIKKEERYLGFSLCDNNYR